MNGRFFLSLLHECIHFFVKSFFGWHWSFLSPASSSASTSCNFSSTNSNLASTASSSHSSLDSTNNPSTSNSSCSSSLHDSASTRSWHWHASAPATSNRCWPKNKININFINFVTLCMFNQFYFIRMLPWSSLEHKKIGDYMRIYESPLSYFSKW